MTLRLKSIFFAYIETSLPTLHWRRKQIGSVCVCVCGGAATLIVRNHDKQKKSLSSKNHEIPNPLGV